MVVRFAEGKTERADLLIGGDGVRSGVRAQVAPEVQPIYAGYYIWRGAPNEADLAPATRASIFPHFTFFLPPRQQVIGYPIAGINNDLRPGHRRYNFIWYRVGDAQQLKEMCIDAEGRQHEYLGAAAADPHGPGRRHACGGAGAAARSISRCAGQDTASVLHADLRFSSPTMVSGRVALVGDAASTARPHMGFGVAKAGIDAQALARALRDADNIDTALARYNAERQPVGERIVQHGRKLGAFLDVDVRTEEDRRMGALLKGAQGQMDHIAVPNFLAS